MIARCKKYCKQHWFLLILLAVLVCGMFFTETVRPIEQVIPRGIVVATVLFLMSLTLESSAMWNAFRQPGAVWLAVAINAGVAPPLAWVASHLLPGELATGLIIAATVPCTLASAAIWTRRAGGNDAVALLVTMITNIACFLVVPGWLQLLVGQTAEIDFVAMMWRLAYLAVAPILLAQFLRSSSSIAAFADRFKKPLGAIAQIGLLSIVLQGAVKSSDQLAASAGDARLSLLAILLLIAVVAGLHGVLFAIGLTTSRLLKLAPADTSAVAIAGSQKTLMIGVDVALGFGGLAVLPMVAYHAIQLLMDTVLADWLRRRM